MKSLENYSIKWKVEKEKRDAKDAAWENVVKKDGKNVSFTALNKPALYAIVQIGSTSFLSQRLEKYQGDWGACLDPDFSLEDIQWLHMLWIRHRRKYFFRA